MLIDDQLEPGPMVPNIPDLGVSAPFIASTTESRFPMYFTPWFLNFVSAASNSYECHEVLRSDSTTVSGFFPMSCRTHHDLRLVINGMPWFGSLSGVLLDRRASQHARESLLCAVKERVETSGATFATFNLAPDEMPFLSRYLQILKPAYLVPRRTQVTSLPFMGEGLEERLMGLFHPKARNAVRKGLSVGFEIERSNAQSDWEKLFLIHSQNMAALGGRAKRMRDFELLRTVAPEGSLTLTKAKLGEKTVALLLLVRVGNTLEYITPTIDSEYRSTQALSALIWTEMLQASLDGFEYWNWGGTGWSQQSLHRFKLRLGGRQENYVTLVLRSPEGRGLEKKLGDNLPPDLADFFVYPTGELKAMSASLDDD